MCMSLQVRRWTAFGSARSPIGETRPTRRHERFIELELMPQADAGAQAAKPETFTSLEALIGAVSEPAILLVGAPGAGKTTLLRHLCYALADADFGTDSHRVVFFLPLAEYPKKNGPGLDAWFAERFARAFPSLGPFDAALAAGQVWLLLDGLNEMAYGDAPNDRFDDLRDALHRLPRANRVIVTCREQDVTGSLGRVRRAEVKPLSAEAVERFLTKYAPQKAEGAYQALVSHRPAGAVPESVSAPFAGRRAARGRHDSAEPSGPVFESNRPRAPP